MAGYDPAVKMSVITCFYSTTDHTCDKPGSHSVLVLDGNMKNARQVCGCRDVGELKFAGMNGSVVVGTLTKLKVWV